MSFGEDFVFGAFRLDPARRQLWRGTGQVGESIARVRCGPGGPAPSHPKSPIPYFLKIMDILHASHHAV
jgi:hypothetical protein